MPPASLLIVEHFETDAGTDCGTEIIEFDCPVGTSISRDDIDAFFDVIMALCESAYENGLIEVSAALEIALDACLIEREQHHKIETNNDKSANSAKSVVIPNPLAALYSPFDVWQFEIDGRPVVQVSLAYPLMKLNQND